jgi:DNA polymerase-3 subunit delta'
MPFRDVVGHVRLIDLLSRSVAGGTLPPSLLFAGPAGIGKRLTALAVAQALNCTNTTKG